MTKKGKIYYAKVDEFWTKEQKYEFLETTENIYNCEISIRIKGIFVIKVRWAMPTFCCYN